MLDVGVGYVRVDWGEWSVVGFPGPEACTNCCNTAVKGGSVRGRAELLGGGGNEHDDDPVNYV